MHNRTSRGAQKPRELRRRVMMPARLRHGASWSDACILNISSRGLMIHTGRPMSQGTMVEVRRGDHAIVARVMWRDGARAGLQSEERVPIEEIVTVGQSPALQLTAASVDRRTQPRAEDRGRSRGRAIEFAGVLAIGACVAGAALTMVEVAFARPLAIISAALVP
jgi:hypothetical protein